jgi:isoleucyl-tRNA synthetase
MAPFTPFMAEDIYQNLVRSFDDAAPESVHLCDWPVSDASKIDARLADETRLVMHVSSLGRAARAKAQIKVRQPVAELLVKLPSAQQEQALERLAPQLLEELNVRALRVVRDQADFLRFEVKPNLKLLGQKYGSGVKEIAQELASADEARLAEIAAAVTAGGAVMVAGRALAPDELLVNGREREGFASAGEHGKVVIVSTEMTPELLREGLAREIVHRIQNLRKDAGFEIADRIRTYIAGDDDVRDALRAHDAYVRAETLSVEIIEAAPPDGAQVDATAMDGHEVTIGVVRA